MKAMSSGLGSGIAAGVVVEDDDRRRAQAERFLQYRPGFHRGAVEPADEVLPLGDDPAANVDVDRPHRFLVEARVAQVEVAGDGGDAAQRPPLRQLGPRQPASQLHRGQDGGRLGVPQPLPPQRRQIVFHQQGERRQAAKPPTLVVEQVPGEVDHGTAAVAGAQRMAISSQSLRTPAP